MPLRRADESDRVMNVTLIALTAGALLLGALFATLYSAFHVAEEAGTKRLREKYPRVEKKLAYWETRWGLLRGALLICSMIMQVVAIAFMVIAFSPGMDGRPFLFAVALLMLAYALVLTWDLLPRALSESYADRLTILFLPVIGVLTKLLFPLVRPLSGLEKRLRTSIKTGSDEEDRPSPEDEIISVVDQADAEELEEEERELIRSVFEFGETVTREIMTPRVEVESIEMGYTVDEAISRIWESAHSRFPVLKETMDDIQGIVHVKDLLRLSSQHKGHEPLRGVVKKATYVPESMPINDLLKLMRSEHTHLAIVVDEYGGTSGVVTLEDILEELVGDIRDEYDVENETLQRLSDGSIVLEARTPVYKVNKLLDIDIPESEEYESIGGYIFDRLERIPRPGEIVEDRTYAITVQTANARKVHTVRVAKKHG